MSTMPGLFWQCTSVDPDYTVIDRFLLPLSCKRNFTHHQLKCQRAESMPIRQAGKRAHNLLHEFLPTKPGKPACKEAGQGVECNYDMTVFVYEYVRLDCTVWWDFTLLLGQWNRCQAFRRVNGNSTMTNRSLYSKALSLTHHWLTTHCASLNPQQWPLLWNVGRNVCHHLMSKVSFCLKVCIALAHCLTPPLDSKIQETESK